MTVQSSPEPFLVQEVGDQPDTSPEHEQTVQDAHGQVIFGLFGTESAAIAHEVDKADSYASVDVENEIVLLRSCHGLDGDGIVEHFA